MKLRVFIIDDDGDYRSLLSHHVTTHWPEADVRHYNPIEAGRLPESFAGAGNDLVLLGHPAGKGDALDWLRQFRRVARFPPIVFVGSGDERQIVEAMRAGAADYISKSRLSHRRLIDIIDPLVGREESSSFSGRFFVDQAELATGLPKLKGYEFQRRISMNELSAVYLATELAGDRTVVLKVLRQVPDDHGGEAVFDRFLQEYELIAKIDHPNVVNIYDLGIADDHAFIAMEYCSKGSLKLHISRGLKAPHAFDLMRQLAGALGELHGSGITHRDLKPTNIMFREDDQLVLIDFGLAKQAKLQAEITGTGEIFGTPYYMSPEQGHGGEVDARGDIYSLGVIFYEMLTGQKPYDGETAMSVIIQHRQSPVPQLPGALAVYQPGIDRMMAKRPDDRFQTVEELLTWAPSGVVDADCI